MALELTFSCDSDKRDDGPTLIHSTGVESYKIPPEIIKIVQDAFSNESLSDNEDGVLCQVNPQRVLDLFLQNGFVLQNENDDEQKASWTVIQGEQNPEKNEGEGDEPQAPSSVDEDAAEPEAEEAGEEQTPEEEPANQDGEEEQEKDE